MQGPLLDHDRVRAPWGERRSLESMVFAVKLPLWEGLRSVVMRCARGVEGWVRRDMGWFLGLWMDLNMAVVYSYIFVEDIVAHFANQIAAFLDE